LQHPVGGKAETGRGTQAALGAVPVPVLVHEELRPVANTLANHGGRVCLPQS